LYYFLVKKASLAVFWLCRY